MRILSPDPTGYKLVPDIPADRSGRRFPMMESSDSPERIAVARAKRFALMEAPQDVFEWVTLQEPGGA